MDINNFEKFIGFQYNGDGISTTIQNVHLYHPEEKIITKPENFVFCVPKLIETFRGREVEIEQLITWFFHDKRKMVAISGLPGYGKTELAKQFARYCKTNKQIEHIVWVNAESRNSLENSFRELLKSFTFEKSEMDIRAVVQKVYQFFESSSTIFILDNAEDRQSIREFEPPNECLCLVTSQVRDWGDDAVLELTPLSIDGAVAVLRSVLQQLYRTEDAELLVRLAVFVDRMPLALQVAAAYLRQELTSSSVLGSFTLAQYVDHLTSDNELIIKSIPKCSANTYKNSILQTLQISLDKIKNINAVESNLAINILNVCAYLNSERILVSDLLGISLIKNLLLGSDNSTKVLKHALYLLSNYSFIRLVNDRIMIHRFVQNILLYYQNQLSTQNNYYTTCLEFILFEGNESHQHSILKVADKNIDAFFNFYLNYKAHILNEKIILKNLVKTGNKLSLLRIFEDLRTQSEIVINNSNLLREAAVYCQHDIIILLLSRDATVNAQDENGSTALSESVFNLDPTSVNLLTENGADVNATDIFGFTALHSVMIAVGLPVYATKKREAHEIIRRLVTCGARVNTISNEGATLLHTAAYALQPDVMEMLITHYMLDVNVQDHHGWTPLHVVCCKNQASNVKEQRILTAKILLKHKAKLDIENDQHMIPMECAYNDGVDYMVEFLNNISGSSTEMQRQTYRASANKAKQNRLKCLVM